MIIVITVVLVVFLFWLAVLTILLGRFAFKLQSTIVTVSAYLDNQNQLNQKFKTEIDRGFRNQFVDNGIQLPMSKIDQELFSKKEIKK